jgi:hypothetical protein
VFWGVGGGEEGKKATDREVYFINRNRSATGKRMSDKKTGGKECENVFEHGIEK